MKELIERVQKAVPKAQSLGPPLKRTAVKGQKRLSWTPQEKPIRRKNIYRPVPNKGIHGLMQTGFGQVTGVSLQLLKRWRRKRYSESGGKIG